MKHTYRPAVRLTPCGRLADATFPQAFENPPGFPQTHSLDDEIFLLTACRGTDGRVRSLAGDVRAPPMSLRRAQPPMRKPRIAFLRRTAPISA